MSNIIRLAITSEAKELEANNKTENDESSNLFINSPKLNQFKIVMNCFLAIASVDHCNNFHSSQA